MLLIRSVRLLLGDIRLSAPELLLGLHISNLLLLLPQPADLILGLQIRIFAALELASPILLLLALLPLVAAAQRKARALADPAAAPKIKDAETEGEGADADTGELVGREALLVGYEVVAQAAAPDADEDALEG